MKTTGNTKVILSTVAILGAMLGWGQAIPTYNIQVFPPRSGYSFSSAIGINKAGAVLINESINGFNGEWANTDDAYVWTKNGIFNINANGLSSLFIANGIGGDYVCGIDTVGQVTETFRYNFINGTTENLSDAGTSGCTPYGINENGDVVGVLSGQNLSAPAVWFAGTTTPDYFFAEGDSSTPLSVAINLGGTVLGFDNAPGAPTSAWAATNYVSGNTSYANLTFPGCLYLVAEVLNDAGVAAGVISPAGGIPYSNVQTVVWTPSANGYTSTVISPNGVVNCYPAGINNSGEVVGGGSYPVFAGNLRGRGPAWVYLNGQFFYLNNQIGSITPGYEGWYPWTNWGVNDAGQIVGTLTDGNGNYAAFLATPISSSSILPSSYSLFRGTAVSGDVASLNAVDGDDLIVGIGPTLNQAEAPVQVVVNGTSPVTAPTSLTLTVVAKASSSNVLETIYLYNYSTASYVSVGTLPLTTSNQTLTVTAPGTASQFVNPATGTVQAKVAAAQAGPTLQSHWQLKIDQVGWTVSGTPAHTPGPGRGALPAPVTVRPK